MTEALIIKKAIEEVEAQTLGTTKQFLEIHQLVYFDDKPKIARLDLDKEDEAIVYFMVENEKFFLAVSVDRKANLSVRWVNTEPYHAVYFRATSENLSLEDLTGLTKLKSTRGRNKGDTKNPGSASKIIWKQSTMDIEPNPEADEFEDKLTKLLDYLEQDIEGVEKIGKIASGRIQVYSSFHNGNTLLGGYYIDSKNIKRMSELNLAIDFDSSADGNFFK